MNVQDLEVIADSFQQRYYQEEQLQPEKDRGWLGQYEDGWTDPLTKWSLGKISSPVETLIILLDWNRKKDVGQPAHTIQFGVDYCQKQFDQQIWQKGDYDATFATLFWSYWSRRAIECGHCLVINAVWGVRLRADKIDLPDYILNIAKDVVCNEIISRTSPERIYVSHTSLSIRGPRVIELYHPGYSKVNHWALQLRPEDRSKSYLAPKEQ
jgi:hypothetical protein